ncbi:MAG: N-acetylglucosamine 6-phosphate deacetylase [Ilumatobacteraceae bacterium]
MNQAGPNGSDITLISGASVVIGRSIIAADVVVGNGHIVGIVAPDTFGSDARPIDGRGCTLAPGFVDLQLNGAAGFDFTTEPDRLPEIAAALPRTGVTSFLPTVITSSAEQMALAISVIGAGMRSGVAGARPLGLHVEGPFIAGLRRGAHPARYVRDPDADEALRWLSTASVALVTIAPELPGAPELIRQLVAAGVTVSVGHTAASVAEIAVAVAAGVTGATHLFNAMGTMSAREPGPAGARTGDGVLAGSVLRMEDAFRNLIALTGCSVADASVAASSTPARLLRRDDVGAIRIGARGDLVLLDDRLRVAMTMIVGIVVHDPDDRSTS